MDRIEAQNKLDEIVREYGEDIFVHYVDKESGLKCTTGNVTGVSITDVYDGTEELSEFEKWYIPYRNDESNDLRGYAYPIVEAAFEAGMEAVMRDKDYSESDSQQEVITRVDYYHNLSDKEITEIVTVKLGTYRGELDPCVDANDATVVVERLILERRTEEEWDIYKKNLLNIMGKYCFGSHEHTKLLFASPRDKTIAALLTLEECEADPVPVTPPMPPKPRKFG